MPQIWSSLFGDNSWLWTAGGTNITSFDPPLPAVGTAYSTEPLLTLFRPPVERAGVRPRRHVNRDWWVDFSSVRFAVLVRVELGHS